MLRAKLLETHRVILLIHVAPLVTASPRNTAVLVAMNIIVTAKEKDLFDLNQIQLEHRYRASTGGRDQTSFSAPFSNYFYSAFSTVRLKLE
jgi:hypothetical protein